MLVVTPLVSKRVERNIEPFFLAVGTAGVSLAGLWSWELLKEAPPHPVAVVPRIAEFLRSPRREKRVV
ncbi:DUF1646 family protein [Pyrobaculum neutrophilum]|uniref:DUF1646 family protein n=1 Tax=Pyrobaculum neutrophilum TaxID=70771 RepID=UPI0001616AF5|nr:DUF1646 family protein [Pyrobaculum neutrophilum]